MLCFEVRRNKKRIAVAGVGAFGVLSTTISWVSHEPERIAEMRAEGRGEIPATELKLHVGGLEVGQGDAEAHVDGADISLEPGDTVTLRVIDKKECDVPASRRPIDHARDAEGKKQYVRHMARQFGWEVRESKQR